MGVSALTADPQGLLAGGMPALTAHSHDRRASLPDQRQPRLSWFISATPAAAFWITSPAVLVASVTLVAGRGLHLTHTRRDPPPWLIRISGIRQPADRVPSRKEGVISPWLS